MFTVSTRPSKHIKIRAYVNNTLLMVSLDSGATISVISKEVAKEYRITRSPDQVLIKGLDQNVTPCQQKCQS